MRHAGLGASRQEVSVPRHDGGPLSAPAPSANTSARVWTWADSRKRPSSTTSVPTKASFLVWQPLLHHLTAENPAFPVLLAEQLVSSLLDPGFMPAMLSDNQDLVESTKERDSARWCLSTWLLWLWQQDNAFTLKREDKTTMARRVMSALISDDSV